jgi:hypothetical protein
MLGRGNAATLQLGEITAIGYSNRSWPDRATNSLLVFILLQLWKGISRRRLLPRRSSASCFHPKRPAEGAPRVRLALSSLLFRLEAQVEARSRLHLDFHRHILPLVVYPQNDRTARPFRSTRAAPRSRNFLSIHPSLQPCELSVPPKQTRVQRLKSSKTPSTAAKPGSFLSVFPTSAFPSPSQAFLASHIPPASPLRLPYRTRAGTRTLKEEYHRSPPSSARSELRMRVWLHSQLDLTSRVGANARPRFFDGLGGFPV